MSDVPATHVTAGSVRRSLCGLKDPLPLTHIDFVRAHVRGRDAQVCRARALEILARDRSYIGPRHVTATLTVGP